MSRVKREYKRRKRRFSVVDTLVIVAAFVSVVAGLTDAFRVHSSLGLYLLAAFFLWMFSHYCRGYHLEKQKAAQIRASLEGFHRCCESFRTALLSINSSLFAGGQEIGSVEWANAYMSLFRTEAVRICEKLREGLRSLGYPVEHVCIKSFNLKKRSVHVVGRYPVDRIREFDDEEKIDDNIFARLLIRAHCHHPELCDLPELANIRRNQDEKCLRFLAIGNIAASGLPKVFSQILMGEKATTPQTSTLSAEESRLLGLLRTRADGKYNSCLGMMISRPFIEPREATDDKALLSCGGFIGTDSHDTGAWDFLDADDLHALSGIADALYPLLAYYEFARDVTLTRQLQLPMKGTINGKAS